MGVNVCKYASPMECLGFVSLYLSVLFFGEALRSFRVIGKEAADYKLSLKQAWPLASSDFSLYSPFCCPPACSRSPTSSSPHPSPHLHLYLSSTVVPHILRPPRPSCAVVLFPPHPHPPVTTRQPGLALPERPANPPGPSDAEDGTPCHHLLGRSGHLGRSRLVP